MTNLKADFSNKAQGPEFAQFRADTQKWTKIFAVIVIVACWVGFPVIAIVGEMEITTAIILATSLSVFIFIMTTYQGIKAKKDTTWYGTVVDKRIAKRRHVQQDGDNSYEEIRLDHIISIKRDDSPKLEKCNLGNGVAHYNYYNIGDRIKHHAGFYFHEKQDKSMDSQVICINCGRFNDINSQACRFCKLTLLT